MTKVKTSELSGAALDWAVAMCEGYDYDISEQGEVLTGDTILIVDGDYAGCHEDELYRPSRDWAQGGPIIEREKIAIDWDHTCWNASVEGVPYYISGGATALETAMRCYVALKLGKETEVPEELA